MDWKLILTTSAVMFGIDVLYLQWIAKHFQMQISLIQGKQMTLDYGASALCYLFLVVGIYVFVLCDLNVRQIKSWNSPVLQRAMWRSAILGWVIYGVYELTNKATIQKWMWKTVFMDTIWGGILFALTTLGVWGVYHSLYS